MTEKTSYQNCLVFQWAFLKMFFFRILLSILSVLCQTCVHQRTPLVPNYSKHCRPKNTVVSLLICRWQMLSFPVKKKMPLNSRKRQLILKLVLIKSTVLRYLTGQLSGVKNHAHVKSDLHILLTNTNCAQFLRQIVKKVNLQFQIIRSYFMN